ncbi:MAG: endonuclease [Acidimicrobiaceae bacterium]
MPEGDTIHRTANRLRPVLVGQSLVRFEARRATGKRPLPGTTIDGVDAVGKHLLIRFAGGVTLRTHMRMTGSWHLYRTGERWKKPAHLARAVVEVEGWTAVCFAAPVVELETSPVADANVAHLGPDLAAPDVTDADIDAAVDRMPNDEIGVVLLDQRVACGIGNIWKNETLFACGVDPFRSVADIDRATRRALIVTASKFLRASVRDVARPGNVYARAGRACRRCGTPIRARRQGEQARTTYWCPTCQK